MRAAGSSKCAYPFINIHPGCIVCNIAASCCKFEGIQWVFCRVDAVDSIFFNLPNLHFLPCPVVASKVHCYKLISPLQSRLYCWLSNNKISSICNTPVSLSVCIYSVIGNIRKDIYLWLYVASEKSLHMTCDCQTSHPWSDI